MFHIKPQLVLLTRINRYATLNRLLLKSRVDVTPKVNSFMSRRFVSESICVSEMIPSNIKQNSGHKAGKLRVHLLKTPSHYGHYSSRVNRPSNEDRYNAAVLQLPDNRDIFNYNIFDGHGGEQCANFLEENLSREVESGGQLCIPDNPEHRNDLVKKYWKNIGGYWKRWYKHKDANFAEMFASENDINLLKLPHEDDLRLRIPLTFLNTDYDFFSQKDNKSGSTCTSLFLETIYSETDDRSPGSKRYYFHHKTVSKLTVAQVGDTKAILVDRDGIAHPITQFHHPSNPIEAKRLRKYAANFFMTDSFGEERFISLANTRSFGDIKFKQVGVTAEPDISQLIIGDRDVIRKNLTRSEIEKYTVGGLGGGEAFLVLCSDGVSSILTDQEIADIAMVNFNMKGQPKATAQSCAEEIIHFVEYIGGDDNATCMVIRLNGWGKWPIIDRTGELRQQRLVDFDRKPPR